MTSKLITCSDDGTEVSSQRKKIRNKRHPYQKEVKLPLGFPGSSSIKNPPAMQETQEIWVPSLGQEDPLEEEMATHSTILAWEKSHGQKSLAGYSPEGLKSQT